MPVNRAREAPQRPVHAVLGTLPIEKSDDCKNVLNLNFHVVLKSSETQFSVLG